MLREAEEAGLLVDSSKRDTALGERGIPVKVAFGKPGSDERMALQVEHLRAVGFRHAHVADKRGEGALRKRSFLEGSLLGLFLYEYTSLNKSPFLCSINGPYVYNILSDGRITRRRHQP